MVAGTLCDTKAALLPLCMARRMPIDVNAVALDANSTITRRARLLPRSFGMALLLSQRVVLLFETQELSLEAAELIFRRVNRANMRFSF
jgi:hypothetical protein